MKGLVGDIALLAILGVAGYVIFKSMTKTPSYGPLDQQTGGQTNEWDLYGAIVDAAAGLGGKALDIWGSTLDDAGQTPEATNAMTDLDFQLANPWG